MADCKKAEAGRRCSAGTRDAAGGGPGPGSAAAPAGSCSAGTPAPRCEHVVAASAKCWTVHYSSTVALIEGAAQQLPQSLGLSLPAR
jgi:hypothetical protein